MEEAEAPTRYWCHMCSQTVNPILELDSVKCPICQCGFVEEMTSSPPPETENDTPLELGFQYGGESEADRERSLNRWAPILLGLLGSQQHRHYLRRLGFEDGGNDHDDHENHVVEDEDEEGERELTRELEAIARRRRRSSYAIVQLLQGMQGGMLSEPGGDSEADQQSTDREREPVILINPLNQTIVVQGSYNPSSNDSVSHAPAGSLGDYFVGPGLDMLLQHLSENDPNRYGTPPARKEAVRALPTVKIEEKLECSVCLDDCEIGDHVKEMPCKHKFHTKCILPWLELHSSCPVCRHQLPFDESKLESSSNGETNNDAGDHRDGRDEQGRQFPWPFASLFSSSTTSNPSTSDRDQN